MCIRDRYYAQRASAGLLITEGMPVSEEGRGYLYTPGIYNDEHVQGWRKVTQACLLYTSRLNVFDI